MRKSRYEPQTRTASGSAVIVTEAAEAAGRWVAGFGYLSTPQLVRLMNVHPKKGQRLLRRCLDSGLLEAVAVSPALLDSSRVFGTAPNIYRLTRRGVKRYGGKAATLPTLMLRHELAVRDVAAWFVAIARTYSGGTAQRPLNLLNLVMRPMGIRQTLPDALGVVQLPGGTLATFIEVDRGTERGEVRWERKVRTYAELFASGEVQQVTGFKGARILTFCSSEARRNSLCELVAELDPGEGKQYWFTVTEEILPVTDLAAPLWLHQGAIHGLIPPHILHP